jgi:hypothetical protein
VIQAIPAQWVQQQALILNGFVTRLADTERIGIHSLEGGIHII